MQDSDDDNDNHEASDLDEFVEDGEVEQEIVLDPESGDADIELDEEGEQYVIEEVTEEEAQTLQDEEMDETPADDSIQAFLSHTDSVYCLSAHPTSPSLVISGGGDDRAFIWDITSGSVLHELKGHDESVVHTGFNTDGNLAATADINGNVKVWEVSSGRLVQALEGPSQEIGFLDWHSKGNVLLVGSQDSCSYMWKADTGALMGVFPGHASGVTCGLFTPDGKQIVTGSADCSVRVWNPKNQATSFVFSGNQFHEGQVNALACKTDSSLVLTGGEDGASFLININTGKVMGKLVSHTKSIECVGFSSTNPFAVTGGLDHNLIVWDLYTIQPRLTCKHDDDEVTKLAVHPSSPLVATGCTDGIVRLWDERNGNCVKKFNGHADVILDLCFSRDGASIISCCDDHSCRVFQTGQ